MAGLGRGLELGRRVAGHCRSALALATLSLGGALGGVVGGVLSGVLVGILGGARPAEAGCGPTVAQACAVSQGSYHIALPGPEHRTPIAAGQSAAMPAVVFLHGYGGSGRAALNQRAMVQGLKARGYAVIAPDALSQDGGPRSWNFFPGWQGRDEVEFLQEVAADAAARFDLDRQTMILAGFSAGGFMVNYLACSAPGAFAGYAPIAGGFWRPQPAACAGEIRLFHSHGWNDGVVPLEGRFLGGGRFQQGDIFAGLELWRATNHCAEEAPDRRWQEGEVLRRRWDCGPGADIEFLLFPQGHQVPDWWSGAVLDWFETPQQEAG
ncbi:alpha/beta hydrolase family esterase [Pseudophaeobacter arcticus]|uniref:alpha/beta hydrolase family esterase n=1 Tax=Pseudophaeobacter arcticus TaxID=385492 RepID=UPI000687A482|nr:alpha/beta fold hydrolase [Pseudophaeobacter arcticus]